MKNNHRQYVHRALFQSLIGIKLTSSSGLDYTEVQQKLQPSYLTDQNRVAMVNDCEL